MTEVDPKRYFPAFVDLESRLVVVIGCGKSAEKRARQFSRYGADVTVICPKPSPLLIAGEADGALSVEQRPYVRGDLGGAFLVVCTEEDAEVRKAVFEEAQSVGCLVNITDAPQYSNFLISGVVRKGRLEVAISTGGAAPEVAKSLRAHLTDAIGDEWVAWTELIVEARHLAANRLADDAAAQAALLTAATDPETRERIAAGESLSAEQLLEELAAADEPSEAIEDDEEA